MKVHLEIVATGPLTTVQDLGRPGYTHWGVARSGAADRGAARLANRLVGNPESAACLEITFGGLQLRADGDLEVAVTGAPCPATSGERPIGGNTAVRVPAGELLALGRPTAGLRSYLAVRGGLDVDPVLGSCATDTLGQLGPPVVAPGHRLRIGAVAAEHPPIDQAAVREPTTDEVELRVFLGPRADRFTARARWQLFHERWTAAADSNRIGLRLTGVELERASGHELASEGVVRGSLQVPPDGPPTLFLADHPVTGGYPVVAVVLDADVDRAAQVRPGQHVRFRASGGEVGEVGAAGAAPS